MSKKPIKPLSMAVGTAIITSFAASNAIAAVNNENPFAMNELSSGYMQVAYGSEAPASDDGSSGKEGQQKQEKEGKCGEGKCGDKKDMKKEMKKDMEGKCGEGKCGDKK